MARTVSVRLTADASGLVAAFAQGAAAAQGFAAKASSAVSRNEQGLNSLSRTAGLLGLGIAAGIGVAVKSFADFDSAMSSVAATGTDARGSLDQLRDAAIQAGAKTKFSATEAAGGIEALAKAGVSANDILGGGLAGALNLAAAGNLDVAGSAEAAATAMNQFGLAGKDIPHIADLLAQAAGTAQGEVSDMAAALKQSGLVASQFGLTIDETSTTLALFAKNGLVGSDAGTSLKTMLLSLASPSKLAAAEMERLGISAYDLEGRFVGIGPLADQLKTKLAGVSDQTRDAALSMIFGNDAIRASNILYDKGSQGLSDMAGEMGAFGTAAQVAFIKMNNLRGDIERFKGSLDTALIGAGEGANGPLRDLAQGAEAAANAFNGLGSGSKTFILSVAGVGAAALLGAAGVTKLVVVANSAKVALAGLGISARAATIAAAGIGAAIGIAAFAFAAYATNAAESRARVDDFTTALLSQNDAIQENVTKVAGKQLQDAGALTAARGLGLEMETITAAALGNAAAMEEVRRATEDAFAAGLNSSDVGILQRVDDARVLSDAVRTTGGEYNSAVQSAKDFGEATGTAAAAAKPDVYAEAAAALGQIGATAADATGSLQDLAAALFEASNAALASSNAAIGYEQAVDAAADAAEKNGKNLKIGTEAGRENRTALNNLAAASQKYVQSQVELGKSSGDVAAATKDARKNFIDSAVAMGKSVPAAKRLADQYGLIPKKVKTDVEANIGKSQANLALVKNAIKGLPKKVQADIIAAYKKSGGGVDAAKAALAAVAKIKTNPKIDVGSNSAAKARDAKRDMGSVKDSKSNINVSTNAGSTANSAQRSMNSVQNVTRTINIQTVRSSRRVEPGTKNMPAGAYGGPIEGYSPHDRADNILVAATAGEFMHDVPAVRYWGGDFMEAVLRRDKAAVASLAALPRAYGGPILPTYASPAMHYALASGQGGYSGPRVHAPIAITMPAAADPMAAASGAGGRVATILSAIGV